MGVNPKTDPAPLMSAPSSLSLSSFTREDDPPKSAQVLAVEERIVDAEKLRHEVLCGICCMLLSHPKQCLSGHVYCGDCVQKCIIKGMPCPACRRLMTEETVARNLFLEEYCSSLLIHCQYHYQRDFEEKEEPSAEPDEEGCPAQIPYKDLEQHERECKYSWIRCPFTYKSNAVHMVRKNHWSIHRDVCEFRPSICRFCDGSIPHNMIREHEEHCPMLPLSGNNCKDKMPLRELAQHKKEKCQEEMTACPFADHGCGESFLRKDLATHMEASLVTHLSQLQCSYDEKLKAQQTLMEKSLDQAQRQVAALKETINAQSSCSAIPPLVSWEPKASC